MQSPEDSPPGLRFVPPGIDLENIVYYKDDTHYFVMTAKKQCLLRLGVLLQVGPAPRQGEAGPDTVCPWIGMPPPSCLRPGSNSTLTRSCSLHVCM